MRLALGGGMIRTNAPRSIGDDETIDKTLPAYNLEA